VHEHPDAIARWKKSLSEALAWMLKDENFDEAVSIGAEHIYKGKNRELVSESLRQMLDVYRQPGWSSFKYPKSRFEAYIAGVKAAGFLPQSASFNYADLVLKSAQAD
jgi:hypothetical protein